MHLPKVKYEDLGLMSYGEALAYQKSIQQNIIHTKRNTDKVPTSYFLLCEHKPVYTLGKSGSIDNLMYNSAELEAEGIEFHKTNRGGDITYHGPGQITGYPIMDLDQYYHDVHKYVRDIELAVINVLHHYGIIGQRLEGYTGVWILKDDAQGTNRKICAIGIHMSRWVSMHGFALNVNSNLSHFSGIVPCGIQDESKTVTSIAKELKTKVNLDEVKDFLKQEFQKVFQFNFI